MTRLLAAFVLASTGWVASAGAEERPLPVVVHVVDDATRQPITEFAIKWMVEMAGVEHESAGWSAPLSVQSAEGLVEIPAPQSGLILVRIHADDYQEEYSQNAGSVLVFSTDRVRQFVMPMERGKTVRGKVVEQRTGKPIAGAAIGTTDFFSGLRIRNQQTATDAKGEFVLRGQSSLWGVAIEHPHFGSDYISYSTSADTPFGPMTLDDDGDVAFHSILTRKPILRGLVTDAEGRPLPDAVVRHNEEDVKTNSNGRFEFPAERNRNRNWDGWGSRYDRWRRYRFRVSKDGFLTTSVSRRTVTRELHVVLQPAHPVHCQVVAVDGARIDRVEVLAETVEYPFEEGWPSDEPKKFTSPDFTLRFPNSGERWIGLRSPGYAPCLIRCDVPQQEAPVAFRLHCGATLKGQVETPPDARELKARLISEDPDKGSARRRPYFADALFDETATVAPDGAFRFEHLATGDYKLWIEGDGVTPHCQAVRVGEREIDVGRLKLLGNGSLRGRLVVAASGVAIPFFRGTFKSEISGRDFYQSFRTDENGDFLLSKVSVGPASVSFLLSHSGCFVTSTSRKLEIREREETTIDVRDNVPARDYRLLERWTPRP